MQFARIFSQDFSYLLQQTLHETIGINIAKNIPTKTIIDRRAAITGWTYRTF